MSSWNDFSRERLIQEYKKYPCLWSSKDDDAKNVEKRRECLNLITLELNKYEEKPFSQDEIRTQFKNLRDMYRRKRKKLHSQQEINPGAVIDEPGWIYFTRLKFLDDDSQTHADFGPPNESQFPTAPTPPLPPPPPKKKGKTTIGGVSSKRTPDDSSLPTPFEADDQNLSENNNSILIAIKQEKKAEIIPQKIEIVQKNKNKEIEQSNSYTTNSSPFTISSIESLQKQPQQQHTFLDNDDSGWKAYSTIQQQQTSHSSLDNLAETAIASSFNTSTTTTKNNNELIFEQTRNNSSFFCEDNNNIENDEFSCFGRFIAATLRKISSRSALDALEARKAIGDVLYGTELRSLQQKQ